MLCRNKLLLILFCACLGLDSKAAEGFFNCSQDPKLQSIWNSVLFFKTSKEDGSAFLVKKAKKGSSVLLSFITARHVVDGGCPGNSTQCEIQLGHDVGLKFNGPDANGRWLSKSTLATTGPSPIWLADKSASVVRSEKSDLALVTITSDDFNYADTLIPVSLPKSCPQMTTSEKFYRIGFPALVERLWSAQQNVTYVPDQVDIMKERCSAGQYLFDDYDTAEDLPRQNLYHSTNADALPGSSGGPLVNENGVVIGVTAKAWGDMYNDVDDVPCEDLKSFLDSIE